MRVLLPVNMLVAKLFISFSFVLVAYKCSKLDILGDTFKKHVNELKKHKEIDLVFLVDASSSVGEQNFLNELRFVRKLLSDITVSKQYTNIAVITFGSKGSVFTHVDDITNQNETNKCTLLNELLPNIQYSGGGTYTLGAFQKAQKIIAGATRNTSSKALFLITDGFSNGGNPIPVADKLKNDYNVTVFTIGIKTGRCGELQQLASVPETCFLLGDYKEFESLARRALHADLQDGEYIPVSRNKCGDSCDKKFGDCTCGSGSGQYACRCKKGYYGNGEECQSCPGGTWFRVKDGFCVPCPDPNHESKNALSQDDCKCKRGYKDNNLGKCEVIRCPELKAPENGYFVGVPAKSNKCFNILYNACGMRCHVGYSLRGNSIRLCQVNGDWTGVQPMCEVKKCKKPSVPLHGQILQCVNKDLDIKYNGSELPNDMPVDTECTFQCDKGHAITGSSLRTCLPVAQWDGLRTTCKPIRCHRLGNIPHGHWKPENCTKERQPFESHCSLACKSGFSPVGKPLVCESTERGPGKWSSTGNKCVDNEPPAIRCPKNITLETEPGTQYGRINISAPKVADNSELNITIWSEPFEENDNETNKFDIGTTIITYHAADSSGNEATCNMSVQVNDKEPPTIENCDSPPPFITADPTKVTIQWEEPLIYDNSQEHVEVIRSHNFGIFPVGTTQVKYTAIDTSNNTNTCVLNITVTAEATCDEPPTEAAVCSPTPKGVTCALTCQDGYGFSLTDKAICLHDTPGIWNVPECTLTESPLEEWQVVNALVDCYDNQTSKKLEAAAKEDENVVLISGCGRSRRSTDKLKNIQLMEFRVKTTTKLLNLANKIGVNVTIGPPITSCKNGSILALRQPGQMPKCAHCPKGTYSFKKQCLPCPPDTFASKTGSIICEPCPVGRSTLGKKMAKSKRACKAKCPPGLNKQQKSITCTGRYRKRLSCERPNVCKNNGKCLPIGRRNKCICAPGWIGSRCRLRARTCLCQNNGTCIDNDRCLCPPDFVGDFCELNLIDVQPEPEVDVTKKPEMVNPCRLIQGLCENNGTCIEVEVGKFSCSCTNGYIGRRCNLLPCDYNPCPSNTVCVNVPETNATKESFKCVCPEGQENPPKCNAAIKPCQSEPCLHGGTCINLQPGNYFCECPGNYYGERCQLEKDSNFILHFPRSGIHDLVLVDGPKTDLSDISVCIWLETDDKVNYGTILSYATAEHDNAFTLTDYSGLVIYVNGFYIVTDVHLNDGHWHHLCVTWTVNNGTYRVFVNSKLTAKGQGLSNSTTISGNGKIVLGQEQDSLGGRYSRAESFIGKLGYVEIWSKVLTEEEVAGNMYDCSSRGIGNVRTWAEFKTAIHGFVRIQKSTFCGSCSPPGNIENGKVTLEEQQRVLYYKCDPGFELKFQGVVIGSGSLKRRCTVASEWEHAEEIKCDPVLCPYPGYVPYAQISGTYREFKYKDQLEYKCIPGYEPQEPQIRYCTENGTWSGSKPLCRGGQCEAFPQPPNTNISVISEHVYDEEFQDIILFEIGTQLDISCLNGAVLQGEKLLSCQENGTWDYEVPSCDISGCTAKEMPQIPTNVHSLTDVSGVIFDVGTIISFKCINGHKQIGNNQTECLNTGKWSTLNLTCTPIQCVPPVSYSNMHLTNNNTLYYFGDVIKYECDEGYVFYGNNAARCILNGKWTKIKGQCTKISCNKPNVKDNETIVGNSYLFKDSLRVLCPEGSKNSEYSMNCTSAGKWMQIGDCNK